MKIFDAHLDTFAHVAEVDPEGSKSVFMQQHYPNLIAGDTKAGVFVIYTEGETVQAKYEQAIAIMEAMSREVQLHRDKLQLVTTAQDLCELENNNKLGLILGIEGMQFLEINYDILFLMAQMGVRHGGLTWNEQNAFAAGAGIENDRGLTDAGKKLVADMESLHMVVDLAHANEKTFYDVAATASKPFIVSHSAAWSVYNHPRNLKDDQLRVLAEAGGIIGLNAWRTFLADANQSIDDFMRHLVYIVDKIGVEHVGFGFDFCDYLYGDVINGKPLTKDLQSSSDAPNIIPLMDAHGFSKTEIERICYQNFADFFKKQLG